MPLRNNPAAPDGRLDPPSDQGRFPATRWSVVLAVGGDGTREAHVALEALCGRYWLPVYVKIRASGRGPQDAEDLTQDFFARLLQGAVVEQARPERGRFRTFLLTALDRFLVDDWRERTALKRGGGQVPLSIDRELGEQRFELLGESREAPDRLFDRQWATELLGRTFRQLEEICRSEGRTAQFAVMRRHLAGRMEAGEYQEIARELGVSEGAARSVMFRLRKRFRRLLREEIAETVGDEESVEDEIQHLFSIFSG